MESALVHSSGHLGYLLVRAPRVLIHALIGLPLVLLTFLPGLRDWSLGSATLMERVQRWWARDLLSLLGIDVVISGRVPNEPAMYVANHISWLDVLLLRVLAPMWMVAKAEIRHWPLVGAVAELAGTLFIQRGSEISRRRIQRRMSALLRRGQSVGLFPEAGIPAEPGVGRFHARLFGPAIRAKVPVVPVTIRYERDGDLHEILVFRAGESFVGNLLRVLRQPRLRALVMISQPVRAASGGRSELARLCQREVSARYES